MAVVVIYGVLFMETKDEHNPFLGVSSLANHVAILGDADWLQTGTQEVLGVHGTLLGTRATCPTHTRFATSP
jgi:hypothetical protein